jgi:hypothetical protein
VGAECLAHKKIYGTIEAWRNRPIEGERPYVYLDGIAPKRSWAGGVRNVSLRRRRFPFYISGLSKQKFKRGAAANLWQWHVSVHPPAPLNRAPSLGVTVAGYFRTRSADMAEIFTPRFANCSPEPLGHHQHVDGTRPLERF